MKCKRSIETLEVKSQFSVGNGNDTLGIKLEKPKFPQYAVRSKRADSYKSWPEYLPLKPDVLIEAGLVYTGVEDSVRCYHCGGGLRNWEEGDVPFEEHAKWYPTCPHVLLVKGQSYVDALLRGEKPNDGQRLETKLPTSIDLINTPAAQSCIQMNFSEASVRKAIEKFKAIHGHINFSGELLCDILFKMEKPGEGAKSGTKVPGNIDLINTPAAQSCIQMNFSEALVMKAIHIFKVFYGHILFKGQQLCKILFEIEHLEDPVYVPIAKLKDTSTNNDVIDSTTSIEENEENARDGSGMDTFDSGDFDSLVSENQRLKENQMCNMCMEDVANVIVLPCGHMVSCPQCGSDQDCFYYFCYCVYMYFYYCF